MSKIIEIHYLESTSLTNLSKLVNDCISRGWQPFGAVVYYEVAIYKTNCVQAVVKYEELPKTPIPFTYKQFVHGEAIAVPCGDGKSLKNISHPGWEGMTE